MYYPCSENKGPDQLRGYREADLRLCFRICKKPVFSRCGSLPIAFYSLSFHRLFGCYEALDGGDLGEALEDFTGGVSEQLDIGDLGLMDKPEERTAFYARLQKEVERKSLLAASIPVSSLQEKEKMSCVVRKPTFCICENKDADQLCGNREADQRLCFRYIDSTIPLFSKSKI